MSRMLEARAADSGRFLEETGLPATSLYVQAYVAMFEAGWLKGYLYALKLQEEQEMGLS